MPKLPAASCSGPSKADQLKSLLREREIRNKWKENVASSSIQALSSSEEGDQYFELEESNNEWAEELKRANPTEEISAPCPWATEWRSFQGASREEKESWVEEFEGKEPESSWTHEYTATNVDDASTWIEEFKEMNEQPNDEHLVESASELLSRLDLSDDKLKNSQFVAYLRNLADGRAVDTVSKESSERAQEAFESWQEEFRRAIDPLVTEEDATWETWKKDWQEYEANGNGYEGFAFREFRRYQFALNNPYLSGIAPNPSSLRERILEVEADLQRNPSAALWVTLAALQGENEMDIQAIAAYQESLQLDPSLLAAWAGLALCCLNERCIPDAYEAIANWIRKNPTYSQTYMHNVQSGNRNSELLRCILRASSQNDVDALILTSVLQNLGAQPEQAINTLQRALSLRPTNPVLLNRLGATMANFGRYSEALSIYDQALSLGFDNPRLHYNRAVSLMSMDRYAEAQQDLVQAIQQQLPVSCTHNVRPDLRAGYQSIWNTLRLLCELMSNNDLAFEAEMGNLAPFL